MVRGFGRRTGTDREIRLHVGTLALIQVGGYFTASGCFFRERPNTAETWRDEIELTLTEPRTRSRNFGQLFLVVGGSIRFTGCKLCVASFNLKKIVFDAIMSSRWSSGQLLPKNVHSSSLTLSFYFYLYINLVFRSILPLTAIWQWALYPFDHWSGRFSGGRQWCDDRLFDLWC